MNDTIHHHAWTIEASKDTIMIQTKSKQDLLIIQKVSPRRYNLFQIDRGTKVLLSSQVTEQNLTDKIVEFAAGISTVDALKAFIEASKYADEALELMEAFKPAESELS